MLQRSPHNTTPRLITIEDFRFVWLAQLAKLRESIDALRFIDVFPLYGDHSRQFKASPRSSQDKTKKRPRDDEQSVQSDKSDKIERPLCTGCGRLVVALQFDLKNKSVEDKTDQLLADIVEAYPDLFFRSN